MEPKTPARRTPSSVRRKRHLMELLRDAERKRTALHNRMPAGKETARTQKGECIT